MKQVTHVMQHLLATSLLMGMGLMIALPSDAQTAAGTTITNEASATYEDPNNPGTPIDTVSNTVTVDIAEVAGITVSAAGFNDLNGSSVVTGDDVEFNFLVSNVGNDPTRIFVPGANNIDIVGGTITSVEIRAVDGASIAPITVPGTGAGTAALGLTVGANPAGSIPAGSNFLVVVTVDVTATAPNAPISIQFGDTDPPGPQNAQNIADSADGGGAQQARDVRTIDNPDGTVGETAGSPVNGEREAAAFLEVELGTSIRPLALAQVTKVAGLVTPGTPATTDDQIRYDLGLQVLPTSPNASFSPAALEGTSITLNGSAQTRVLVSDAIPANTDYIAGSAVAPAGWTVVYSVTPIASATDDPLAAAWTTTEPGTPANVTRVGFIFTGTLSPGTNVSGFNFRVVTNGLGASGGTIANLAQAFGETVGDPTNDIVYDESGDQNPNNFNDDDTPPSTDGSDFDPNTDNGVADPANQGTDNNNNNTGTGPGGETTVVTVTPPGVILNGPENQPGAVGPTDTNDDFVNASTNGQDESGAIPAPGDSVNPPPVQFVNTFRNPGTGRLNNVFIRPISPAQAQTATGNNVYGVNGDLPVGTLVTITLGLQTATYNYTGSAFSLSTGAHVFVDPLAAGAQVDYNVSVDLPAGSVAVQGYGIPIVVFVEDGATNGIFNRGNDGTSEPIFNIKIDRVYTGYLELVKEARILDTDGTTVLEGFTTTPSFAPQTGQFIEYRIRYTNISEPSVGVGNVILNASNVVIDENGTVAPNNWALDNDSNSLVDTAHVQNVSASQGPVQYFNGGASLGTINPATNTNVTRYVNNVGTVVPQANGTFTFRRRIN
ncbi:MAG: hypothetical protein OHK0012_17280 [Synechococcales cyanobacterium]